MHRRLFQYFFFFLLQCLSPEHVTNGRVHHPGLNGSSKSLATSTHPMLARGTSADRFSPLEPRDFEVESLSRKTVVGNSIIILKGKHHQKGRAAKTERRDYHLKFVRSSQSVVSNRHTYLQIDKQLRMQ